MKFKASMITATLSILCSHITFAQDYQGRTQAEWEYQCKNGRPTDAPFGIMPTNCPPICLPTAGAPPHVERDITATIRDGIPITGNTGYIPTMVGFRCNMFNSVPQSSSLIVTHRILGDPIQQPGNYMHYKVNDYFSVGVKATYYGLGNNQIVPRDEFNVTNNLEFAGFTTRIWEDGKWATQNNVLYLVPNEIKYEIRSTNVPFIGSQIFRRIVYSVDVKLNVPGTPAEVFVLIGNYNIRSAQSCTIAPLETIHYAGITNQKLRNSNNETPDSDLIRNGSLKVTCENILAPIKVQFTARKVSQQNAFVVDERDDIGFRINKVDENGSETAIVPNDTVIQLERAGTSETESRGFNFKAWPVYIGSSAAPLTGGVYTGRATVDVEFD